MRSFADPLVFWASAIDPEHPAIRTATATRNDLVMSSLRWVPPGSERRRL
jgi:hypothetical protein